MHTLLVVHAAVLLFVSALPAEVTVKHLDGTVASGKLLAANQQEVSVEVDGERRTFRVHEIQEIAAADHGTGSPAKGQFVEFSDGSRLAHTSVRVKNDKAQIELPANRVEAPAAQVTQIRYRSQDETLARAWNEIAAEDHRGDVLIIRKVSETADEQGNVRTTVALDYLEGVVREVQPELIKFEYDGDVLDVRLEKVEGILFHRTSRPSAKPICLVTDVTGSSWQTRSFQYQDSRWVIETVSGVKYSLSQSDWARTDFSAVNTQYLSDLSPERSDWKDYLDRLPSLIPSLPQRYGLLQNEPYAGGSYSIAGRAFYRGLTVFAGSELTYRLPEGFDRLRGVAGLDDRNQNGGDVRLVIRGDGRELLAQEITGQASSPVEIDLDVRGVRRLTIVVDYGARKLQTNCLDLCDIRVTK